MTDFINTEDNPFEFSTQAEIINDLISRLHEKDRRALEQTNKSDLQFKFPEWSNHIRNFYMLYQVDNPITMGRDVDDTVKGMIEAVWDAVHTYKDFAPECA